MYAFGKKNPNSGSKLIIFLVVSLSFEPKSGALALPAHPNNATLSCYGDLMKLSPTGAGPRTARGTGTTGVKASQFLARLDLSAVHVYGEIFNRLGIVTCLDPALIAALATRESNVGKDIVKCNGWGDCRSGPCQGCRGWGILQCDVISSSLGKKCLNYAWNSEGLMEVGLIDILIPAIKCVQKKMPQWSPEQQLQGGVAAYNFGCRNVRSWANLDQGTANNDYSNDVIARAQWLKSQIG